MRTAESTNNPTGSAIYGGREGSSTYNSLLLSVMLNPMETPKIGIHILRPAGTRSVIDETNKKKYLITCCDYFIKEHDKISYGASRQ